MLIFDQFEEFFFVYPDPVQQRQFFEFVGECLNILPVKVILSLREDYLHYLLECDRLSSMKIIGNDILTRNVRYPLGNFSPADAKVIIQQLTERSYFHLEPALIEELVQDLAGELGKVRPIELQIVGAQLQTENITTLTQYRECGQKVELVKRYLAEVVKDCGAENQEVAELVLYLLTDEKGTRPLKTRAEVERDLQALASADLTPEVNQLDLVFKIFVDSGLVVLLPELPADRYQLVHDYLAEFIRQQQEPKLNELRAELERERKQRKISDEKLNQFLRRALRGSVAAMVVLVVLTGFAVKSALDARQQKKRAEIKEIEALSNSSETLFASNRTFDALIESLKAGGKLKQIEQTNSATADLQIQVRGTLQQAVYGLTEGDRSKDYSKMRERNTLEGHSSWVTSVSFSPD
ncbi:MAG TPA: ribosome assembly protein 4, partial [Cyanobacteria bacterium UBA8553]|nr:ribosome assembly protein 4 [Cyanobacteria bacterium UBA8553]